MSAHLHFTQSLGNPGRLNPLGGKVLLIRIYQASPPITLKAIPIRSRSAVVESIAYERLWRKVFHIWLKVLEKKRRYIRDYPVFSTLSTHRPSLPHLHRSLRLTHLSAVPMYLFVSARSDLLPRLLVCDVRLSRGRLGCTHPRTSFSWGCDTSLYRTRCTPRPNCFFIY